jgi:hypothetical protein
MVPDLIYKIELKFLLNNFQISIFFGLESTLLLFIYKTEVGSVRVFFKPNRVKILNKLTNVLVPILDKVTKSRDSPRIVLGFRLAFLLKISWIQELGFKSSSCFSPVS